MSRFPSSRGVAASAIALLSFFALPALAGTTWDGGDGNDAWNWNNNWNPDGSPTINGGVDLTFGGTTRLTPNNNYSDWSDLRSIYFISGAGSFTISGNSLDLYDGKIENNDDSLQTVSLNNLSFNNGSQEVNPVSGNLTLGGGGNIFNNGQYMDVYGDSGYTLTLGMAMQGAGGISINQNSIVNITAAQTYTGDTYINEGSLRIDQGGSLGGTIVRVGRTSGSDAAGLYISDANGGTTEDATLVIRDGSSGTLTVGGLNTSGDNTFSGGMSLDNNVTLSAASGGRTIFSGQITDGAGAGTFGAAINAAGTVQLAGSGANSGVSAWTVQEGTLELNKSAGTDAISSSGVTIENGGTLKHLANNQMNDSGSITVQSGGTLNLNSFNETVTSLDLQSGSTLSLGTGDLTLSSQGNNTWAGTISGSAGSTITRVNNGNTVSITGNNSFDGDFYVDGGTVGFNHNNAIGSAGTIHVGVSGGAYNSTIDISVNGVSVGADIVVESGAGSRTINQAVGSGTVTFSGDITLNKDVSVTADSGETLALSGQISGGNKVVVSGGGSINLSGTSTYTGNTEIDAGTVNLSGDLSDSSHVYIGNGGSGSAATLALSGSGATLGNVTINPTSGSGSRDLTVSAGSQSISGTLTVNRDDATITVSGGSLSVANLDLNTGAGNDQASGNGDQDVSINNSGSMTISGTIDADTGNSQINKSGSGTLTISGNNSSSYYMLNIAGGTVAINSANALGSQSVLYNDKVNFNSSGTLQVTGNTTLNANMGFRVANGQTATFDVGNGITFSVAGLIDEVSGGSGNIIKSGSGTMVISGTTAYNGSTTLSAGTLQIDGDNTSSSGIQVNGGTLNVQGTADGVTQSSGTVMGDGTISGNYTQNGGTMGPGNSPGTLTVTGNATWSGGTYLWEINDVLGTEGTDPGWDLEDISGTLTINGGYTIYVDSLVSPGNAQGDAANFNMNNDYSWRIAHAAGGVTVNSAPSLDVSGFSNPYNGTWSVTNDATGVYVHYEHGTGDPPPSGGAVPEPDSLLLLAAASVVTFSLRKQRMLIRQKKQAAAQRV